MLFYLSLTRQVRVNCLVQGQNGRFLNCQLGDSIFQPFGLLYTCKCLSVNTTGSVRNTLLDSLLMEAAMTWELTANPRSPGAASSSIFTVAFSVDRKEPKFLYRTNTTLTWPGGGERDERQGETSREGKGQRERRGAEERRRERDREGK
uniref:Uncharacterized protein n=1 Tax=Oncorhynchus kisutch TaxID=8019 RepID=A0A8C7KBQ0_ONCKI